MPPIPFVHEQEEDTLPSQTMSHFAAHLVEWFHSAKQWLDHAFPRTMRSRRHENSQLKLFGQFPKQLLYLPTLFHSFPIKA